MLILIYDLLSYIYCFSLFCKLDAFSNPWITEKEKIGKETYYHSSSCSVQQVKFVKFEESVFKWRKGKRKVRNYNFYFIYIWYLYLIFIFDIYIWYLFLFLFYFCIYFFASDFISNLFMILLTNSVFDFSKHLIDDNKIFLLKNFWI